MSVAADLHALFAESSAPHLVLAPDAPRSTIREVNGAYFRAALRRRDDPVGRPLFEACPDNPAWRGAAGVANLRASLMRVLATRGTDAMAVQRYDIERPDGRFEERH